VGSHAEKKKGKVIKHTNKQKEPVARNKKNQNTWNMMKSKQNEKVVFQTIVGA
jgi:hypothetical protein